MSEKSIQQQADDDQWEYELRSQLAFRDEWIAQAMEAIEAHRRTEYVKMDGSLGTVDYVPDVELYKVLDLFPPDLSALAAAKAKVVEAAARHAEECENVDKYSNLAL